MLPTIICTQRWMGGTRMFPTHVPEDVDFPVLVVPLSWRNHWFVKQQGLHGDGFVVFSSCLVQVLPSMKPLHDMMPNLME